jgi:tetratricopeptide (TPR) repeat protein
MAANKRGPARGVRRLSAVAGLLALAWAAVADEPPQVERKPPFQRLLRGGDAEQAAKLKARIDDLTAAGKFAEAVPAAKELLTLRQRLQGADHWEAVDARQQIRTLECRVEFTPEQQADYRRASAARREAQELEDRGRYAQAQPLREQVLAVCRRLLGEENSDSATCYNNLAMNLQAQGKYAEAEQGLRKALELGRKVLGEHHPHVAAGYNNLAMNLQYQGKYAEAEQGLRKALALRREVLGEEHADSATSYDNLALTLSAQGKHAEAEALHRKALALRRKLLGEDHPDVAESYNNLALNLQAQGKYAEAEEGLRKALELYRKRLGDEHPYTVAAINNLALNLQAQGKYAEAEQGFRRALDLCRKVLGEEHPNTATSYNNLALVLGSQGKYAEAEEGYRKALALYRKLLGEEHPQTALGYNNLALTLHALGKYAEADENFRKALDLRRKVLGEEHPDTAQSYSGLALNLLALGKYAEADECFRKALALRRKLLGEEHLDTAESYTGLALSLTTQGKYAEAEGDYRRALVLTRRLLGDEHPLTAIRYNSLAGNLQAQGKYAEAEQASRKALALCRKVLGEEHPDTASSYNSLAVTLSAQGKYAEAEEYARRALDLDRKLLGEEHPHTVTNYNNLATNLYAQGKYAEAEEVFRKALTLSRKVLGEDHPDTALAYNNLAVNLSAQEKYAGAEQACRNALALFRKHQGEGHPFIATTYNNLASNLQAMGKYAEAEEDYRKALDLYRKLLGEDHPDTAQSCLNLAFNLAARGFHREAEEQLDRSADVFARARPRFASSGLERAATGRVSPLPFLAALLVRQGEPERAWQRFEQGLGRGTWDDLQARLAHSPAEQTRLAELARRLERLDGLLEQYGSVRQPSAEQTRRHKDHLTERRRTQEELDTLTQELARKVGLGDTQAAPLARVQAALPDDTALLGWVDSQAEGKAGEVVNERWAVLLRSKGPPVWDSLKGSGKADTWTDAADRLPRELRSALHSRPQAGQADWRPLARRLYQQRVGPLEAYLGARAGLPAVRHLVVLPSGWMDGVPLDVLCDRTTFSLAPSATVFAFLRGKAKPQTSGLLALADPVFDRPDPGKAAPLPAGGVLLTAVVPDSNAARAGLHAGDVLLRYQDTPLKTAADLRPQAPSADAKTRIPVEVWRAGEALRVEVLPGPLGVSVAKEPAAEALARRRRIDADLVTSRDGSPRALPGTRVEAAALARRFREAGQPVTLLTDSDASEQRLAALVADGGLGKVRYLHLATHGTVNWDVPLRSAILLSRDRLPDPTEQLNAGRPVYTGRLTAAEVLRDWDLGAELVTLSACETGLGHYAEGEGYLGFAQALLLCGSRSVCLSLWQVDDAATALLMDRFYANLLGQRHGLTKGMGKAEALAEAKAWLRTLPRAEAVKRAAALTGGVERGAGREALPRAPAVPETANDEPPYAHPYYWAAFVLVGDPG